MTTNFATTTDSISRRHRGRAASIDITEAKLTRLPQVPLWAFVGRLWLLQIFGVWK